MEKNDYQEWANVVQKRLMEDQSWVKQYKDYAKKMIKNREAFKDARKCFNVWKPLYAYLTIGKIKDNNISFDLRYLGQSVGSIDVKGDKALFSVNSKQSKNSKKYFGYDLGEYNRVDWKNEGKEFRKFFRDDCKGKPRQKEHMVESALFSELGKTSSKDKTLCNITPITYASTRIHMKTAVSASKSKNDKIEVSSTGGEIDLLCRRSIKMGRAESRIVVIEIKDENKKNESFDMTMKQAISYAVFIRELIYSDAGMYWMDLWGMEKQKKQDFIIDCVVAMPKGKTKPGFERKKIKDINRDGKDCIELHFMELSEINSERVRFNHSF